MARVVVIGGGLSGLSAAHTVLERGGRVLLLEKMAFMGGNSTKATSGINGAGTRAQAKLGIPDTSMVFEKDSALSASKGASDVAAPLTQVLTWHSGPAVEWLQEAFGLDLSLVARLGGHSFPRTHRGPEKFPGMVITYALMKKYEAIIASGDGRAELQVKACAKRLIQDSTGAVTGVEYEQNGKLVVAEGPVVVCTGGFAADFSAASLLKKHRPDLMHLPTTNGEWATGDGIKMAVDVGAGDVDLDFVQVHPTGLIDPKNPDNKVKFLAAEALRGCGGLIIDRDGHRVADELGRRDYVTGEMWKANKAPYRLFLNGAASREIEWHCKHYCGRGVMKHFNSGAEVAAEMGISPSVLKRTFDDYNGFAKNKNDPFGKKFFPNMPLFVEDEYNVAIITPVIHYCMGGLVIDTHSRVLRPNGEPIPGLFAGGEVAGGVHGKNRLGGSSLLDCVVFGRVSGATAAGFLLNGLLTSGAAPAGTAAAGRIGQVVSHLGANAVTVTVSWGGPGVPQPLPVSGAAAAAPAAAAAAAAGPAPAAAAAAAPKKSEYTAAEVAKHNSESDCWVIVNGKVLDVTSFLGDHPGGANAIVTFAGRDATEEFNMLHEADVIEKYAPDVVIGTLKG